jgi:hypothetical protein
MNLALGLGLPLVAALIWLIAANVIGMLPSRDHHWRNAYVLIAVGVPILIWLSYAKGLLWGLVFLIAAGSVLRWPLIYLMRWLRRLFA